MQTLYVVLDVMYLVFRGKRHAGLASRKWFELDHLYNRLGDPLSYEGVTSQIVPVLTHHHWKVALNVLTRELDQDEARATEVLNAVFVELLKKGAELDRTREHYPSLKVKNALRGGPGWCRHDHRDPTHSVDTEDEAVLACAERYGAILVTDDHDLRYYARNYGTRAHTVEDVLAKTRLVVAI